MMKRTTDAEGTLHSMIGSFVNNPPDTDYQRGYLSALLEVWLEVLNLDHDDTTKAAERLTMSKTAA